MPVYPANHRPLAVLTLSLILSACGGESADVLLTKAQQSLDAGDRKAAIIHLKSAVQADEGNAEARYRLGKLQLEGGDFASAEKELKRARQAGYDAAEVNPLLAKAMLAQGEFQRVLDELPQPAAGGAADVPLLVARATAQLGTGAREDARQTIERAFALAPQDADVLLAQARLALAEKNPEEAMRHVELALQNTPRHREAWLLKAELLRAGGQSTDAAKAYRTVLDIDPDHTSARLALASFAIDEDRFDDARREIDSVLKNTRNQPQARYLLALIEFRENKLEAARERLAGVLKNAPGFIPAVLLAGTVEFAMGNLQTAEAHLNRVLKTNPENMQARRLLAATQLRQNRVDDAARTLSSVHEPESDAGFHLIAGEVALARKDYAKAAAHFEAAAQLNPDSAALRTELGIARLAQGDARAMADLQAAATMDRHSGRADTVIIVNQLREKQFDAALASLAALEKKQGSNPLIWNFRGAAYLGKKDPDKARESFTQALKLDARFFPAAVNLAQLDLRDKQLGAARQRFEDILKVDPKHLDAMLALADLAQHAKDEKLYVDWLNKAAAAHPQALRPRVALARHQLARGDKAQALATAREAVNAHPDAPLALETLGAAQLANGDTTNALGTYRKLVDQAPQPAVPLTRLAAVQASAGQLAEARKSLGDALRAQPDLLEAQMLLGRLDLQQAHYDDALKLARQIQQQKPKSAAGPLLEGDVAMARQQFAGALAAYERAHTLEASGALLLRQHEALSRLGRAEEGDKRVNAWLARNPQDVETRLTLAGRLLSRKQYKLAAEHYLVLEKRYPDNVVVLNNLAWALHEMRDARALNYAEKALKLVPDNPMILDTTGWILVQQGQSGRGIKLLQEALSRQPDAAEIQWHLAAAYAKNGDSSRAQNELTRLLASGKSFPQEKEARALLEQLQGKPR